MILKIHEYVSFITKWGITTKQFLLAYTLYLLQWEKRTGRKIYSRPVDDKQDIRASLYHYMFWAENEVPAELSKFMDAKFVGNDIKWMKDRGVLHPDTTVSKTKVDELRLSEAFIQDLFLQEGAFLEFWEAYPAYLTSGDKMLSLKVCDKDELELWYFERIVDRFTHERVVSATVYGKQSGLINMSIENYLKSEYWKEIEKEQATAPRQVSSEGYLI